MFNNNNHFEKTTLSTGTFSDIKNFIGNLTLEEYEYYFNNLSPEHYEYFFENLIPSVISRDFMNAILKHNNEELFKKFTKAYISWENYHDSQIFLYSDTTLIKAIFRRSIVYNDRNYLIFFLINLERYPAFQKVLKYSDYRNILNFIFNNEDSELFIIFKNVVIDKNKICESIFNYKGYIVVLLINNFKNKKEYRFGSFLKPNIRDHQFLEKIAPSILECCGSIYVYMQMSVYLSFKDLIVKLPEYKIGLDLLLSNTFFRNRIENIQDNEIPHLKELFAKYYNIAQINKLVCKMYLEGDPEVGNKLFEIFWDSMTLKTFRICYIVSRNYSFKGIRKELKEKIKEKYDYKILKFKLQQIPLIKIIPLPIINEILLLFNKKNNCLKQN